MDPRDESEGVDPDQTLAGANGVPVLRHLVRAHTAKSVKIDTIDKKIVGNPGKASFCSSR